MLSSNFPTNALQLELDHEGLPHRSSLHFFTSGKDRCCSPRKEFQSSPSSHQALQPSAVHPSWFSRAWVRLPGVWNNRHQTTGRSTHPAVQPCIQSGTSTVTTGSGPSFICRKFSKTPTSIMKSGSHTPQTGTQTSTMKSGSNPLVLPPRLFLPWLNHQFRGPRLLL